ncbi:hypothetical protein ABIE69_000344 [Rhodobacteraceae bacterium MBR-64]
MHVEPGRVRGYVLRMKTEFSLTGLILAAALVLTACDKGGGPSNVRPAPPAAAAATAVPAAQSRGGRLTAEGFDTSSQAERQAARDAAGGVLVGRTVASLGPPREQGFWLRTGLVRAEQPGRVVLAGTATSVKVTLRPMGGDPAAGGQLSLAAFRVLGVPLTTLPQLEVYTLR